jgi:hypothetical protein
MLGAASDLEHGRAGKVTVLSNKAVLPGHLWIGTEDKKETPSGDSGDSEGISVRCFKGWV